jgi:bile acid:Na+ symporter, BASS family
VSRSAAFDRRVAGIARVAGLALPALVVVAAAGGVLLHARALPWQNAVPWLLGALVFAAGFATPPARFAEALRRPRYTLLYLAMLFGPLLLLAWLLAQLPGLDAATATGLLILGVCPTDLTVPAMTLLAAGDAALATVLTASSLLACTLLAGPLLARFGTAALVDRTALLQELGGSVAWPFVLALLLRSARARLGVATDPFVAVQPPLFVRLSAALLDRALALSALLPPLAVAALVFIAAGTAHAQIMTKSAIAVAALCLLYNLAGYACGWALFRALDAPPRALRAGVFATGLREFGVAAALAIAVRPDAGGGAAIDGVVMLISAPLLAGFLSRSASRSRGRR